MTDKAPSKSDQVRALREARSNRATALIPERKNQRQTEGSAQQASPAGSSRLRVGRTAQDRGKPTKVAAVAIRGARPREGLEAVGSKPALSQRTERPTRPAASSPIQKRGPGRPKIEGKRPWESAGLSKRTYYRRKAEGKL